MDPNKFYEIYVCIRITILIYCDSCEYSSNRKANLDIFIRNKLTKKKIYIYIKWKRGHVYK